MGIPDVSVSVFPEGREAPQPTDEDGNSEIEGLPCCSRQYIVVVSNPSLFFEVRSRLLTLVPEQFNTSLTFEAVPYVVVPGLTARIWVRNQGTIPSYTYEEAARELASLRLGVQQQQPAEETVIPEFHGRIAAQSPDPGARRPRSARVRLTVYDSTHARVPNVVTDREPWRRAARLLKRHRGRFRPILGRPRGFYMNADGHDITFIRRHFRDPNGEDIHHCHISQLGLVEKQIPYFEEDAVPGGLPGGPEDATWRMKARRPIGFEVTLGVCVEYKCEPDGCTPKLRNLGLPPVGSELPE